MRRSKRIVLFVIAAWATTLAVVHAERVEEILDTANIPGGLVVHVGCNDGILTAALGANDRYLIQGLDTNPAAIALAQQRIQSEGKEGRVSVTHWDGQNLPYAAGIVNLILVDVENAKSLHAEVQRVLAPQGVAMIQTAQGWDKQVKPRPEQIDDWTHFLHSPGNNAVADDSLVGLPRTLQWDCGPKYCRSHEMDISVAAAVTQGGRLFSIVDRGPAGILGKNIPDNWVLEARDAFSGVLLWERPMGHWNWRVWKPELTELGDWTKLIAQRRLVPATLPRRLVAVDGCVYVTLGVGDPVTAIDAITGETLHEFAGTEGTDEILLHDGVLLVTVRPSQRETALVKPSMPPEARASRKPMGVDEAGHLVAIATETGKQLWKTSASKVLPFTLTSCGPRVFYHTGDDLMCLSRKTGQELWRQPNTTTKATRWEVQHILVAYKDVVLLSLPKSICQAFDAATGELLWSGKGGRGSAFATTPLELFVIDDLLWFTSGKEVQGLDIRTGEVVRTIQLPTYFHTPGHHLRCYRARATTRFILDNKRGIEYLDLTEEEHQKNDWVRGACRYGILPANGLIYSTPTPCSCYQTVLLKGFNAVSDALPPDPEQPQLVTGPAYDASGTGLTESPSSVSSEWPTLRGNVAREGVAGTTVGADLHSLWKRKLGAKLTQPIVANGHIFICSRAKQTLFALDAATGRVAWSHAAGAEIDSPPTYFRGSLLFGCRDGWVYNLRADNGELAWRFRAAPVDRQIVSYGRLESSWPVHGSLLVLSERDRAVVYAAAGRNSYLDGGIYLYGLDVASGQLLYRQQIANAAQSGEERYTPHELEGAQTDILVFDGTYLSMQSKVFDRELNPVQQPAAPHIYATGGFLDDQAWHRNFWLFAPGWTVMNKNANMFPNVGQLLVHDDNRTYGVKYYTKSQGQSRVFYPEERGYYLFCDRDDQMFDKLLTTMLDSSSGKKSASSRQTRKDWETADVTLWNAWLPLRVRAMVKTAGTLFVAGPPDAIPADDPLAPFEGRATGELWAIDPASGIIQAKYKTDVSPVFDGMIAANGKVMIAMENGVLECRGSAAR